MLQRTKQNHFNGSFILLHWLGYGFTKLNKLNNAQCWKLLYNIMIEYCPTTSQSMVGYTNSQLEVGSHQLTIRPTDTNCRRRILRTFTFVIESVE